MKLSTGTALCTVATATALLLGGCAEPAATTHSVHLGHDAAQTVDVVMRSGEHLAVVDDSFNASVGDGWSIIGEPDPAVLRFGGERLVIDNPDAAGSGGVDTFDYVSVGTGATSITFEYSFRGDVQFESVIMVTVE